MAYTSYWQPTHCPLFIYEVILGMHAIDPRKQLEYIAFKIISTVYMFLVYLNNYNENMIRKRKNISTSRF